MAANTDKVEVQKKRDGIAEDAKKSFAYLGDVKGADHLNAIAQVIANLPHTIDTSNKECKNYYTTSSGGAASCRGIAEVITAWMVETMARAPEPHLSMTIALDAVSASQQYALDGKNMQGGDFIQNAMFATILAHKLRQHYHSGESANLMDHARYLFADYVEIARVNPKSNIMDKCTGLEMFTKYDYSVTFSKAAVDDFTQYLSTSLGWKHHDGQTCSHLEDQMRSHLGKSRVMDLNVAIRTVLCSFCLKIPFCPTVKHHFVPVPSIGMIKGKSTNRNKRKAETEAEVDLDDADVHVDVGTDLCTDGERGGRSIALRRQVVSNDTVAIQFALDFARVVQQADERCASSSVHASTPETADDVADDVADDAEKVRRVQVLNLLECELNLSKLPHPSTPWLTTLDLLDIELRRSEAAKATFKEFALGLSPA